MSRRSQRRVGIIGLGIIGQRVSEHLRRRGFSVFVWNRTPRPFPNFVGSPAEIAQLVDYIQIFVSDDDALLKVVEQLKMTLKAQHVVMAHCTVAPHTMRAAAEIVQRRGAQFLDAPFTGSKLAAEKGELVYYIGGDEAAFRRAKPVLEASSKEIIEIGEVGQATTIKVATNMVTAATVQVAAEALALVRNAGMAPEKFLIAMRGNASNSATLTMKLPKMLEGDFDPHFSVKHMLKDVQIASRLGRSHGLSFEATEAARNSLLEQVLQNRGDYDYSSLVRALIPAAAIAVEPEIVESDHPMLDLEGNVAAEKPAPAEMELPPEKSAAPDVETPLAATSSAEEIPVLETSELPEVSEAPEAPPLPEMAIAPEPITEPEVAAVPELDTATEVPAEQEMGLMADVNAPPPMDAPVELDTPSRVEAMPQVDEAPVASARPEVQPPSETKEPPSEPEVDFVPIHRAWHESYEERAGSASMEPEPVAEVPVEENPVAELVTETDSPPKETEPPVEERRGFFSRLFSKSSQDKDLDY